MSLSISLVQMESSEDKQENLKKVTRVIDSSPSEMIVFPEFTNFNPSGMSPYEAYENAELESSEFLTALSEKARDKGKWVVIGVYERSESPPKMYSTAFVIGPDGKQVVRYRKTHLFRALGFDESTLLRQSDNPLVTFEVKGFRVGVMICYEIRFPEIARTLSLKGADVIVVPAAWLKGYNKEEQWITLASARAMENTVYVLTANQIGRAYTGIALAADPAGVIKARASEGEEVLNVLVSASRIAEVRESLPLLRQRRPELYRV
ncbi:MAG: carbon-nitrogen hydrolase family protein [Nitrososphaeria archaeon]